MLTISQLKELLSGQNDGVEVAQICLIFAGKILKDEQSLESQGVKDGLTIHMVIRSGGAKVNLIGLMRGWTQDISDAL